MALNYDFEWNFEDTEKLSQDCLAWFFKTLRALNYPQETADVGTLPKPQSFAPWLAKVQNRNIIAPPRLTDIQEKYQAMLADADQLMHDTQHDQKPPAAKKYDTLTARFGAFYEALRGIENDIALYNSGFDSVTALKTRKAMYTDMERELERLARQGRPFCVALVRIDGFANILSAQGRDKANETLNAVAGLIKQSVRPFDDAYVFTDSEFILCLKQAVVSDGVRALERLKELLESSNLRVVKDGDGEDKPLSLSCCVAEPVADQDLTLLIQNLSDDLKDTQDEDADSVLQYHELSELERFIKSQSAQ
ncbi:MAG: diguanylate cyclase domain-containing protein [Bdellovibrionales bacterium]